MAGIMFFLLLLSPGIWSQDVEQENQEEIALILGIDRTIQLDFAASPRIEIGNEAVLNYTLIPAKQQITLKGVAPGTSSVNIRDRIGDIKRRLIVTVTSTDQSAIVQKLRGHLDDIEGLEISVVAGDVVVGGNIFVPDDIGKVVAILEREEYNAVIRIIELAPQTQLLIAQRMQNEIQALGHKDVTVRVLNGTFVLEGIVPSAAAKGDAEKRATILLPDKLASLAQQFEATQTPSRKLIISNDIKVDTPPAAPEPIPKLIRVTAQFVELVKEYNRVFGFAWRPLMAGDGGLIRFGREQDAEGEETGGITTDSSGTLTATISNLFPKLHTAKSAGYARVVQSGVVVVKNNALANINKEDSNTIITAGDNPISNVITTGFNVQVRPNLLEKENIELELQITVSSTVENNSTSTQGNTVNTTMIVKSKDSAVVGGIARKSSSTDYDRDFPGHRDSIEGGHGIFSFVKSKNYIEDKSQFVVFVTPEVIEDASEGVQEVRAKFLRRSR